MRRYPFLFLLVPLLVLCGCSATTDLTNLGADGSVRAGPESSPVQVGGGAHVSLGKHSVEIQHPLPSGARAAEGTGAPSEQCAGGKCGVPGAAPGK